MNKIDYNKKMLGKSVLVQTRSGDEREVEILRVVDEENFEVVEKTKMHGDTTYIVSMYDIRSLKNEEARK